MTNEMMAKQLRELAAALDRQGGNLYRVRAYRQAAFALLRHPEPVAELFATRGRAGLEALPGVGQSVAYTLEALLTSGEAKPLHPTAGGGLATLPGVGARLVERLRDELQVTTIAELKQAALAGRLARVGVGPKRLAGLMAAAEQRLAAAAQPVEDEPAVADLLWVDALFRATGPDRDVRGSLPPAEVPVLERSVAGGWTVRARYASTALAHRLERARDWVTIDFHRGGAVHQRMVVTETVGDQAGQRVVRGREEECRRLPRTDTATPQESAA